MAKREITKAERELCRIITPEFRVSYPHLFKAQAPPKSDNLKFSITMLFPKTSDLMGVSPDGKPRGLKTVIKQAKQNKWGDKKFWPANLVSCVKDGDDEEYAENEGYKGHWIIKASTGEDQRPSVVDRDMTPIENPAVVYPGCYARAYISAFAWDGPRDSGVSFSLDHVQKLRDGKSFSGKKPVEQVFSPVAAPEEDPDDEKEEENDFR
jgi:hypothetical protein